MHGGSKYLDSNKFYSQNPMTWILGKESIEHSASLGGYVEKHLDKCPPLGLLVQAAVLLLENTEGKQS